MAVVLMAVLAGLITVPAYFPSKKGEAIEPVAFYAVVSIAVIGLYLAYVIPIFLRWRMGDSFQVGPWNNGRKYKWMNPFATFWVGLITIIFILPLSPGGVPWRKEFDWSLSTTRRSYIGGLLAVAHLVAGQRETDVHRARHTISELDAELGAGSSRSRPSGRASASGAAHVRAPAADAGEP